MEQLGSINRLENMDFPGSTDSELNISAHKFKLQSVNMTVFSKQIQLRRCDYSQWRIQLDQDGGLPDKYDKKRNVEDYVFFFYYIQNKQLLQQSMHSFALVKYFVNYSVCAFLFSNNKYLLSTINNSWASLVALAVNNPPANA